MFGKVNPAPAMSKSIRMVFWSLPEPLKPSKTIKNDPTKTNMNENHVIFCFLLLFGTFRARFWTLCILKPHKLWFNKLHLIAVLLKLWFKNFTSISVFTQTLVHTFTSISVFTQTLVQQITFISVVTQLW